MPYPSLGEKRQVSTAGADSGRWLGDRAILYQQPPDGRLLAVDVDTEGGGLRLGAPRPIFGASRRRAVPSTRRAMESGSSSRSRSRTLRRPDSLRLGLARGPREAGKGRRRRVSLRGGRLDVSLAAGTKLGPYEILAPARRGRDGRGLQRARHAARAHVAVKVLPQHLSASAGGPPALRARGEDGLAALASAHLRALRRRARGRDRLPGDGAPRGRDAVGRGWPRGRCRCRRR